MNEAATTYIKATLPVLLVYNIDPTWPPVDIQTCQADAEMLTSALVEEGYTVAAACLETQELDSILSQYDPSTHLIFNWCEEFPGVPHSCAEVARRLEEFGYTFTGADSQALELSMDKPRIKEILAAERIPMPLWQIFTEPWAEGWDHFPAIVKPAFEHSSLGVSRDAVVRTPDELTERIRYVYREFHQPAIVEEFIDGREFHVTVLGNGSLQVLPPAEMDFSAFGDIKDRLCTYESKFDPASSPYNLIEIRLPAQLTPQEQRRLERVALATYRATQCRDYARLDIRLRDGTFYVLDVNHNADISPDTSLALAAEVSGLSYGKLGSLLVCLSAQRHPLFMKYATRNRKTKCLRSVELQDRRRMPEPVTTA